MKFTLRKRIISSLLSITILCTTIASITGVLAVPASGHTNLLYGAGKVDYTVMGYQAQRAATGGVTLTNHDDSKIDGAAKLNDGVTDTNHADINSYSSAYFPGVVYDLGTSYDISEVLVYGFNYNNMYRVKTIEIYASDDLTTLGNVENRIYSGDGNASNLIKGGEVSTTARYVAVFGIDSEDGSFRYYEIEVYGGTAKNDPNLLYGSNKADFTYTTKQAQGYSNGNITTIQDDPAKVDMAAAYTDGDISTEHDFFTWSMDRFVGVVYDLGAEYNLSEVWAYVNGSENLGVKNIAVYASNNPEDIGKATSLIYSGDNSSTTKKGTKLRTTVKARYVAFFGVDTSDTMYNIYRFSEFEIHGSQVANNPNLLYGKGKIDYTVMGYQAQRDTSTGGVKLIVRDDTKIDGAAKLNDGVVDTNHADINTYSDAYFPGVVYDLGATYEISQIKVYCFEYNGNYRVKTIEAYSSNDLDTLGAYENQIYSGNGDLTNNVKGGDFTGSGRYVGIFGIEAEAGFRYYEIEVCGKKIINDPNLLYGESKVNYTMEVWQTTRNAAQGLTKAGSDTIQPRYAKFNDGVITQSATGDAHADIYTWSGVNIPLVIYDLGASYDISKVEAYVWSGASNGVSEVEMYASDSLDTIGSASNRIYAGDNSTDTEKKGTQFDTPITARYVAFAFVACQDGIYRVYELEAYGVKSGDNNTSSNPSSGTSSDNTSSNNTSSQPDNGGDQDYVPTAPNILSPSVTADVTATAEQFKIENGSVVSYRENGGVTAENKSKLTDGITDQGTNIDFYKWESNEFPGMLYDLGAEYSISEIWGYFTAHALYGVNTVQIFGSTSKDDLFSSQNKIYTGDGNATNAVKGIKLDTPKTVRYIAFVISETANPDDGCFRTIEFIACGTYSPNYDVLPNVSGISLLTGIEPMSVKVLDYSTVNYNNYISASEATTMTDGFGKNLSDGIVRDAGGTYQSNSVTIGGGNASSGCPVLITYDLGKYADITNAIAYTGAYGAGSATTVLISASDSLEGLYNSTFASLGDPTGAIPWTRSTVDVKHVRYVSFICYTTDQANGVLNLSELELRGSYYSVNHVGTSLIAGAQKEENKVDGKAIVIGAYAPYGVFKNSTTAVFSSEKVSSQTDPPVAYTLDKLTDGNTTQHIDIYAYNQTDKPGVMYDLGAYYDLSSIKAMFISTKALTVTGLRVYASDTLATLYKDQNLIYRHENTTDLTGISEGLVNPAGRARYVAFIMTSCVDGIWRPTEFEVYGTLSADQTAAKEPEIATSILQGAEPDVFGVDVTSDFSDTKYYGGNYEDLFARMTDGKVYDADGAKQNLQMYGGKDKNAKFVLTYDLGANYDINSVAVYGVNDYFDTIAEGAYDTVSNPYCHQAIKTWDVYMSRTKADLYKDSSKYSGKTGYESADKPDEIVDKSIDVSCKMVRFISFVFTIDDIRYGVLRVSELQAMGELSAQQDVKAEEPEVAKYIEVQGDDGFKARIYMKDDSDAFSFSGKFVYNVSTDENLLQSIFKNIDYRYQVNSVYTFKLINDKNQEVNLDGRKLRVYMPIPKVDDNNVLLGCADDSKVELINTETIDGKFVFETTDLLSYPVFLAKGVQQVVNNQTVPTYVWVLVTIGSIILLGAISFGSVFVIGLNVFKFRKKP